MTQILDHQLNLDVSIYPPAHISDFVGDEWTGVLDAVRQMSMGLLKNCYFYGHAECGKSHLLVAMCTLYKDMNKKAIYLPLKQVINESPQIIADIENYDLVALDDLHLIVNNRDWQEAIFHLFNKSLEGKCQIALVADKSVSELQFSMQDLVSRLAQCTSFSLPKNQLIDDRKQMVLNILNRRNLMFNKSIIDFLIHHGPLKTSLMISVIDDLQRLSPDIGHKKLKKVVREQAESIILKYALL